MRAWESPLLIKLIEDVSKKHNVTYNLTESVYLSVFSFFNEYLKSSPDLRYIDTEDIRKLPMGLHLPGFGKIWFRKNLEYLRSNEKYRFFQKLEREEDKEDIEE